MDREPIRDLVTAMARLMVGQRFNVLAVEGAASALVSGCDGASLRELAGMSRHTSESDLAPLVTQSLADVGIADLTSFQAVEIVLREMVADARAGRLSIESLSSWAHEWVGHDGDAFARPIVELDDRENGASALRSKDVDSVLDKFLAEAPDVAEQLSVARTLVPNRKGDHMPQYAVLIYTDDSAHALDATEDDLAEPNAHGDEVAASGAMLAAYAFTPRALARSIRQSGVSDGPFIDAAQVVAGVYVVEASDEDAALAIASTNPAIRGAGGVEVRLIHSGGVVGST